MICLGNIQCQTKKIVLDSVFIAESSTNRYLEAEKDAVIDCINNILNQLQLEGMFICEEFPITAKWKEYRRNTWIKDTDWKFVRDVSFVIPWRANN